MVIKGAERKKKLLKLLRAFDLRLDVFVSEMFWLKSAKLVAKKSSFHEISIRWEREEKVSSLRNLDKVTEYWGGGIKIIPRKGEALIFARTVIKFKKSCVRLFGPSRRDLHDKNMRSAVTKSVKFEWTLLFMEHPSMSNSIFLFCCLIPSILFWWMWIFATGSSSSIQLLKLGTSESRNLYFH